MRHDCRYSVYKYLNARSNMDRIAFFFMCVHSYFFLVLFLLDFRVQLNQIFFPWDILKQIDKK